MRRRIPLLALCAFATVTATAQVRYRPTETVAWRPWTFSAIESARQSRGATAAEVQAFQTRLQELAAIVKRAPGVSPPWPNWWMKNRRPVTLASVTPAGRRMAG